MKITRKGGELSADCDGVSDVAMLKQIYAASASRR